MAADSTVPHGPRKALVLVAEALTICEQDGLELAVMLLRDVVMVLEEEGEAEAGIS